MGASRTSQAYTLGAMLLCAGTCGCTKSVVHSTWADLEKMADKNPRARNRATADRDREQWAILLHGFEGEKHRERAKELVKRLGEARVPDIWLREQPDRTLVLRGNYTARNAPEAENAQRQTRMVKLDGELPFYSATLVPIGTSSVLGAGPYDLRQFPGRYTLQFEVYDEEIGKDFRSIAEKRVGTLRGEGNQGFYYHGAFRSMVTVGLFTQEQAFVAIGTAATFMTDAYSPAVKTLQKKYPHNLHNGRKVIEKYGGKSAGEQPSSLVKIPG